MKYCIAVFFLTTLRAIAQSPEVPHKLRFANMTLTIRDDARREIQKDVDALTQSPRYFNIKVERAKTYFPIIEKIFKEEDVPDEMKYLVLQESALIPDAVSVSKAVGFWQFKDFTALEMGLRVDREIDERMNIVSSTRAAARYLKKNNYFFNNWLYALQAYQMGAGGMMQVADESKNGASHMDITSKTYWYVKKFLAHMIAFEPAVKGSGQLQIVLYENKSRQSMKDLARAASIEEDQLKAFNKWVKNNHIPDDRTYLVAIPVSGVTGSSSSLPVASLGSAKDLSVAASALNTIKSDRIKINGLWAIKAKPGETTTALAARAGVDVSDFLKYNEISINHQLDDSQYYFESKKRGRAEQAYHKVTVGESLWSISQQYGVRERKLRRFNRLDADERVSPGTTLWLSSKRPRNNKQTPPAEEILQVDTDENFSWTASPPEEAGANTVVQEIKAGENTQPVQQTREGEDEVETTEESLVVPPDSSALDKDSIRVPSADEIIETSSDTVISVVPVVVPDNHVVQQGETLYAIARKYDIELMDIVAWNDLNLQSPIKPGQELKLKGEKRVEEEPVAASPKEIVHEVKASDTLYSVARHYGVTIKELMDWNNKKDFTVSVGEKLRIVPK